MQPGQFLQFANALPEGYILLRADGTVITANQKARGLLHERGDFANTHLREYVDSPEQEIQNALTCWSRSRAPIPAALKWKANASMNGSGKGWRCSGFLLTPAGNDSPAYLVIRCTYGKTLVSDFLSLNNKLTEQGALLHKLQLSRQALEHEHEKAVVTLHSIGDGVITTDTHGKVEYLNPIAESLTGWTNTEAAGRPILDVFNIIHEITRKLASDPVTRCLREGRIVGLANHTVLISREGKEYVIEDSAAPIRNQFDQVLGAVLVFRDSTDDRLARHQLEYLAQHDILTGLKNRHYFEQQLMHAVDVASRGKRCYCLLYIDIDQFKVINDTVGHAAGDELLTMVAMQFGQHIRQGDFLARLGGDEFGVLIDCYDVQSEIEKIADKYQHVLSDFRFDWDNHQYDISCSVGACVVDQHVSTSAEAMRQADIACYVAKRDGRNRFHIYREKDKSAVASMGEVGIISDIRSALVNEHFALHYQPIRALNHDEVMHEVLIRMHRGDDLLTPGAFLPVAERHGLMQDIDLWVLEHALAVLLEHYRSEAPRRLSVNLSGLSLGSEKITNLMEDIFRRHPGVGEYLLLEITETSAVGQVDVASRLMYDLRSHGVRFALDDFGTGFSSFTYLKHLPVDFVKIDGTFVRDIVDDPVDQAMVRSITSIASSLGKTTIAEFVENDAILRELKAIGVDMVQGYHIGKPAPEFHDGVLS